MYRGYKTYRHYINAKLHALSIVISGDETVLDEELALRNKTSVKELSDKEARELHRQLSEVVKRLGKNPNELKSALGGNHITDRQRNAILKLARHNFGWSDAAIFSYIAEMFPEKRKKMNTWEVQNSKIYKLFGMLSSKEADKVIKRLDQIKKRNSGADAREPEKKNKQPAYGRKTPKSLTDSSVEVRQRRPALGDGVDENPSNKEKG